MRVAVVGAGAAGLTAAARLTEAEHEVVVLEAADRVGGRIRSVELDPGWVVETGADCSEDDADRFLSIAAGSSFKEFDPFPWSDQELLREGRRFRSPFASAGDLPTPSLPDGWLDRLAAWTVGWAPGTFYRPGRDERDARAVLTPLIGEEAVDCVHHAIDHAIGWPLEDVSANYVRNFLAWGESVKALRPIEGFDAPFRRLAEGLDVRIGVQVTRVTPGVVEPFGEVDAVVVAVPAPIAAEIVPEGTPGRPSWLAEVPYSAEVTVWAFRRFSTTAPWSWLVDMNPDPEGVGSVAVIPPGVWWTPEGWQGAAVSASRPLAKRLELERASDDEVVDRLWSLGQRLDDRLFPQAEIERLALTRHLYGWPRWSAEHATRVLDWAQRPPIVFAGDWTWHPFVEGAMRSGERAAAAVMR